MKPGNFLAGLLLLVAGLAVAQEGRITTASALRQAPDPAAAVVAYLKAGQAVTITGRDGSWLQARTVGEPAQKGWIRMFDVRLTGNGGAGRSAGTFSRLLDLFRGDEHKGAPGRVTSTIGIRGLTAEELRTARADLRALRQMERFASDPRRALHFADEAQLRARRLGYLEPAP